MTDVSALVVKNKPYPKQAECLAKQYGKEFFAELMDPGCGKSYVAIVEAANLFLEGKINFVVLVAPSGIEDQWAVEQIPEHCPVPFSAFVWDGLNTEKEKRRFKEFYNGDASKLKFLCIKIDAFSRPTYIKFFKNCILGRITYLIIDEASRIKNPEAERTFNLLYMINTALSMGKEEIDLSPANKKNGVRGGRGVLTKIESFVMSAKYRRVLTGSLVTTSPFNVWAPFNFLKYNFFETSYEGFRARHGIEIREKGFHDKEYRRLIRVDEQDQIVKLSLLNWSVEEIALQMKISESSVKWIIEHPENKTPYKRLEELKIAIEPHSFTCLLSDIVELDVVEQTLYVDMTAEQKRVYKETEDEMLSFYDDRELAVVSKLALLTKLSQITSGFFPADNITVNEEGDITNHKVDLVPIGTSNAKINALIAEMEEHNFESPALVFARFTADIELLDAQLKHAFPTLRIFKYYGKTDDITRNKIKKMFVDGLIDVLIANPSLAGIGLNLQRANKTFHYSSDYSFEKRKQANGRTVRTGQKANTVLIKSVVCRKTIDERVLEVLTEKSTLAEYFSSHTIREFLGK